MILIILNIIGIIGFIFSAYMAHIAGDTRWEKGLWIAAGASFAFLLVQIIT